MGTARIFIMDYSRFLFYYYFVFFSNSLFVEKQFPKKYILKYSHSLPSWHVFAHFTHSNEMRYLLHICIFHYTNRQLYQLATGCCVVDCDVRPTHWVSYPWKCFMFYTKYIFYRAITLELISTNMLESIKIIFVSVVKLPQVLCICIA